MLVKPAIFLVLGVISSYYCAAYIFESEEFEQYMSYMLKDIENPSAAMIGLVPEVIVFVTTLGCIVVHLFAILIFKLLKSSWIPIVVKRIVLMFTTFLILWFCTNTIIGLFNVYDGYLIPSIIPNIFWIGYCCLLLLTYFKSEKELFNFFSRNI